MSIVALPQDPNPYQVDSIGWYLAVADECGVPERRRRLAACKRPGAVALRLRRISEDYVIGLQSSADAMVFPFRQVTTSGRAILAFRYGRPMIVSELKPLRDLSAGASFRYYGRVGSLRSGLDHVAGAGTKARAAMCPRLHVRPRDSSGRTEAQRMMAEIRSSTEDRG